ncbi:hypothetical protein XV62_003173 [Escherichia coli]|nr:hypothetical protein [Escherichia coli]EFL5600507.1 hypothetical protein [Escherichia coli]EGK5685450.1 hypothetical protein [Escherichia coli]
MSSSKATTNYQYPRYKLPFKRRKFDCRNTMGRIFMMLSVKSNEELYRVLNWSEANTGFFITASDAIQLIIQRQLADKYKWKNAQGLINPQREITENLK